MHISIISMAHFLELRYWNRSNCVETWKNKHETWNTPLFEANTCCLRWGVSPQTVCRSDEQGYPMSTNNCWTHNMSIKKWNILSHKQHMKHRICTSAQLVLFDGVGSLKPHSASNSHKRIQWTAASLLSVCTQGPHSWFIRNVCVCQYLSRMFDHIHLDRAH